MTEFKIFLYVLTNFLGSHLIDYANARRTTTKKLLFGDFFAKQQFYLIFYFVSRRFLAIPFKKYKARQVPMCAEMCAPQVSG